MIDRRDCMINEISCDGFKDQRSAVHCMNEAMERSCRAFTPIWDLVYVIRLRFSAIEI
jgi:hypothetical protein